MRFNTSVMMKFRITVACCCALYAAFSQGMYNGSRLIYPLDQSPVLTGNYGELRPNHFHAGVDFVTDPKLNLPIHAVADGYISRIKISPYGYGNVLYITHPKGFVTVYAHQHHFNTAIDAYVKQKQTEQQLNDIELFPGPKDFPVKQGDVIGYSGNSGGSTGPHLHFEIRDEITEVPVNPLLAYTLPDTIKPELTHLAFYRYANPLLQPTPVIYTLKQKGRMKDSIMIHEALLAVGFAGYDKENAGTNPNTIFGAKLFFDRALIYQHELNTISFDQGKYVNVFSDRDGKLKLQHCFMPACQSMAIYKNVVDRGFINLTDTNWHTLQLDVYDERHNTRTVTRYVRSTLSHTLMPATRPDIQSCTKAFAFQNTDFRIAIPENALYNPTPLVVKGSSVGTREDYLQKTAHVELRRKEKPVAAPEKYVLLVNGSPFPCITNGEWLAGESRSLGQFSYTVDTISPVVKPVLPKKLLANIGTAKRIQFRISDNLSGIDTYAVYMNDLWQIAEYDAKSDLLTCTFSEMAPTGKTEIRVVVKDKVGNIRELRFHTIRTR